MKMNVFTGVISERKVLITLMWLDNEEEYSNYECERGYTELRVYVDSKKYLGIRERGKYCSSLSIQEVLEDMLFTRKKEIMQEFYRGYVYSPKLLLEEKERIEFLLKSFDWEYGYFGRDELFDSIMKQIDIEI